MSKVISNSTTKVERYMKYFITGFILMIITVVSIYVITERGNTPTPLLLIPFTLFGLSGLFYLVEYRKMKVRYKAKADALHDFEELPDDMLVIRDVYIPYDNKVLECHYVIISKGAVFIVEVEGHRGYIYESNKDKYWVKYRKNKRKFTMKAIFNPINIANLKVLALSNYLKKYNVSVWIQGIVYFSSKNIEVKNVNYTNKIFSNKDEIIKHISNFPIRREIDELKMEKIEKLLTIEDFKRYKKK